MAFLVGSTPAIYQPIFGTPLKWVVMLAPLAFIFFFSFRIHAISAATAQTLFWMFCALIGLSLASVFLVFTGTSIARTFFITAAMFGATSLYGYTTKRDLSTMGSFLFMGLIGVIIASLVNLFIGSSALQFAISASACSYSRASPPSSLSDLNDNPLILLNLRFFGQQK